jgi:hypothetical protein
MSAPLDICPQLVYNRLLNNEEPFQLKGNTVPNGLRFVVVTPVEKMMATNQCEWCEADVHPERWKLGIHLCLVCGDQQAKEDRNEWCIVPLHKSNYILVTNLEDLKGINNKGGFHR